MQVGDGFPPLGGLAVVELEGAGHRLAGQG